MYSIQKAIFESYFKAADWNVQEATLKQSGQKRLFSLVYLHGTIVFRWILYIFKRFMPKLVHNWNRSTEKMHHHNLNYLRVLHLYKTILAGQSNAVSSCAAIEKAHSWQTSCYCFFPINIYDLFSLILTYIHTAWKEEISKGTIRWHEAELKILGVWWKCHHWENDSFIQSGAMNRFLQTVSISFNGTLSDLGKSNDPQ